MTSIGKKKLTEEQAVLLDKLRLRDHTRKLTRASMDLKSRLDKEHRKPEAKAERAGKARLRLEKPTRELGERP